MYSLLLRDQGVKAKKEIEIRWFGAAFSTPVVLLQRVLSRWLAAFGRGQYHLLSTPEPTQSYLLRHTPSPWQ